MKSVFFYFLFLIFLGNPNQSYSCSCIGKENPAIAIKKADAVFVGRILSKEIFSIKTPYGVELFNVKYEIEIANSYKGKRIRNNKTVSIITGIGNGDCGYVFNIGDSYIVYANYKTKYGDYIRVGTKIKQ